jgi:uncharacterized protein YodC (DUF2158 family)
MGAEEHHKADEGQRWAEKEISSETTVVSEVVKLKDGGPRLGTPGAATHTGASAGSCVPAIGYPLPGAPVRWQGGRKARVKETLAQPMSFRCRWRRLPREIQCIRDATLVFDPAHACLA